MNFKTSVALCAVFAVTNLILYIITSSMVNFVIALLMLGYVVLFNTRVLKNG